jgi:hypothetical protein
MNDERSEAVQRLTDLLAQENQALKRLDFTAAVALLAAKEAALADLARPSLLPMASTKMAQRLSDLASENQILLERAIAVQTRVVRIVARACAPAPAATPYNGHGGRRGERAPSARTSALALSTRV